MSVEELIDGMLEGFEGGKRWTKGSLATTVKGVPTDYRKPAAEAFCLAGMRALVCYRLGLSHDEAGALAREFSNRMHAATGCLAITKFNDTQESFGRIKSALEAAREGGK